jgi:PHP family Zn ribbon phosphoesterase
MNRVCRLADRKVPTSVGIPTGVGTKPKNFIPFVRLIPLAEIIADVLGVGTGTKSVDKYYKNLINVFGNEFKILLEIKKEEITVASLLEIGEGVERVRQGKVSISPGYDGEFGKISIFGENEKPKIMEAQKTLWS